MRLYFATFLVTLSTVCFSTPTTRPPANKTESFYGKSGKNITKILPQGYLKVERTSKILSESISNIENADSLRSPVLQVSSRQDGLTGDTCTFHSDCDGFRTCQPTDWGRRCFFPDGSARRCDRSEGCSSGERCYRDIEGRESCWSESAAEELNNIREQGNLPPFLIPIDGDSISGGSTSGGSTSEGSSSITSTSDPCIGTHLLTHLSRNQLLFEKDILSNVLCDEHNSCATAGHMVSYHGKGMMMKSYCKMIGGCTKEVMHVNSPRYNTKAMVPSLSENMVFTAFSARYVTRAEEGMLAMAIKFGF